MRRRPCIPRVGGSSPTAGDFSLQQWYVLLSFKNPETVLWTIAKILLYYYYLFNWKSTPNFCQHTYLGMKKEAGIVLLNIWTFHHPLSTSALVVQVPKTGEIFTQVCRFFTQVQGV